MPSSGNGGFIGFADEVTPGTRVAATRFVPLISENVQKVQEHIDSKAIIPGQFMLTQEQRSLGTVAVSGPVEFELAQAGLEVVFRHILGAVSGGGVNEVQQLAVDATGGTFTITYAGQTTSAIAYNAAASAVTAALVALSNLASGDVVVTGGPGSSGGGTPYILTFGGTLSGTNVAQITASGASLTGGAGTATPSTTTPGGTGSSFTRTYTMADLEGQAFTAHIGRPDVNGTTNPFEYTGCKIAKAEIGLTVGELGMLKLDLAGMDGSTNQTLATPSYLTDAGRGFSFVEGAITIGGDSARITKATFGFDNAIKADRYAIGQPTSSEPLTQDYRDLTVNLEAEFESLAHYAAYEAADIVEIECTLTSGANSLTITETAQYDANGPNVAGKGILTQSMPFKVLGADDVSVVMVNGTASP